MDVSRTWIILVLLANIRLTAGVFNWNDIQLNQEWYRRTSETPGGNIILNMITPCTKPAPKVTWKYRVDPNGSFTHLSSTYTVTSESASGCLSGQKYYVYTLGLPGDIVSFYNKKITFRIEVKHDSFNPIENYTKYRDSQSIQFAVPVSTVNINSNNSIDGYEGDTILLTCTTSASFPAATVTWFKGRTKITGDKSFTRPSSGVLVITRSSISYTYNRTDQDQRIYCQAASTPGYPAESSKVQLNIVYPFSKPAIIVPNEVCAGSQISLTCSSSDQGNPQANYQWTKDGNNVNTGVTSGGSIWTFPPSKDDNGATIACSASNAYTERPGYSRVQSDVKILKVYYTPILTVEGDPTRREGQDLSLTCRSDSQDAVVTWSRGGIRQGSTLTVRDLSRRDDGNYTCTGRFDQACAHLQTFTVVHVVVNYAPDITDFKSVTMDEGQPLKLSCQADGRPSQYEFKPFVQFWGDQQAGVNPGEQSGSVYTLTTSRTSYLDTGVYECNVNNGVPDRNNVIEQRRKVQVIVRGKPVMTSDSSQEAAGVVGTSVQLFQTFYTSGLDITSYNWTFGNTRVVGVASTSQTEVTLVTNGVRGTFDGLNVSLFLTEFKQQGLYTVHVCSILGCGSSNVNLMSKATASKDQPTRSSSIVLGLGIPLGLALLIILALTVVVIKIYRDKSAGNNDRTGRQRTENQSASAHPEYDSLDDITPRPSSQLHVDNTVNEHTGYLTLAQDHPVIYETVALHEYENTKSKSKDSPYMNTS